VEYGVEAAAHDYFGTDASHLTLAQAAMLAAIPQDPPYFSPYSSPAYNKDVSADYFGKDALIARQHYILDQMVDQVRAAVAWLYRHADQIGGDRNRIFVSGHSSGAHLAAAVATTDWKARFGLPQDVVKGALCCSGIYDLEPVRLSARNTTSSSTRRWSGH